MRYEDSPEYKASLEYKLKDLSEKTRAVGRAIIKALSQHLP